MNSYEHTIIIKQDLQENQSKKVLNKYEEIITKNLGKIVKIEDWGLLNFARPIKNNKKGLYFHIKFDGEGKTIDELEKAENIDDKLIRYLTVKVNKHDLETNYFGKKEN